MYKSRIVKAANVTISDTTLKLRPQDEPEGQDTIEESSLIVPEESEPRAVRSRSMEHEAERARILSEARKEAELIIEKARGEATKTVNNAETEAQGRRDAIKEEARAEGYEDGAAEGRKEGERLTAAAAAALKEAERLRDTAIERLEPELVELMADVSERLLTDRAAFLPATILCLIRQGLTEATSSGDMTLRVSPEDYAYVEENKEELMRYVKGGAKLDVVKDMSLNKSDCIIETAYGYIDSSLGQQLSALRENLYYIRDKRG